MLERHPAINQSFLHASVCFGSPLNAMKSFIVLIFDYFFFHILVITIGSTSGPPNLGEDSRDGDLRCRSTSPLAKRAIPNIIVDNGESSKAVAQAPLYPSARVDAGLDPPGGLAPVGLPQLDEPFDVDEQAEEVIICWLNPSLEFLFLGTSLT